MKKTTKISIAKARAKLTELIDRTALANEEFIITKCGKPRAKIVPLEYFFKHLSKIPLHDRHNEKQKDVPVSDVSVCKICGALIMSDELAGIPIDRNFCSKECRQVHAQSEIPARPILRRTKNA